ncbi:MAG: nickel-dependent lactate racemase [Desulfobacterales bacterium]|nr:nickel-dependent lactate racemase [Desulfobacterales bacterium]
MKIELPYGDTSLAVEVPDHARVVIPEDLAGVADIRTEIRRAIDNPIGTPLLTQLAAGKSDAVIVINDITRPAPSGIMLEELLRDLSVAGINEDKVTVVIATGNHRPNTGEEIKAMIGPGLASRLRVVNHDCDDRDNLTSLGHTDSGLPVWINRLVAKGAFKIATGLITPHHGAGYSGGRKSVMPGVAGLKSLNQHHSLPIRPYHPAYGWMKGNPFHEEAVKVARKVGVDFILNVVKNSCGQVVAAVAGELETAHANGVSICRKSWQLDLPHQFDVVIVTPGGYPRDIDLHQSQKAMSTAEMVVAADGAIVLLAECRDGIGKYADWLKQAETPRDVIARFECEGFTKDHSSKAFMCARALAHYSVHIFCDGIPAEEASQMFFKPAATAQAAIDAALALKGPHARVLVLPQAVSCVPCVKDES